MQEENAGAWRIVFLINLYQKRLSEIVNLLEELTILTRTLTPTDVSQFNRLDRCERFLRLRMYERSAGNSFLKAFDVAPQSIPPLLTRSGREFEASVEAAMRARYPVDNFAEDPLLVKGKRVNDNKRLLTRIEAVAPGEVLVVTQPRLDVTLDNWRIRGDLDILRVERNLDGALSMVIADAKSSTSAKVEHRLQVAFYHAMMIALLSEASVAVAHIETAILYRGPANVGLDAGPSVAPGTEGEIRDTAEALFGAKEAYLEIIADSDAYLMEVQDLISGPASVAGRIAGLPFEDLFFALNLKCDGCLYNEYCLKESYLRGDLSLVPYMAPRDKRSLLDAGIKTVESLATLKNLPPSEDGRTKPLVAEKGKEQTIRQIAGTSAGSHLDELILRARRTGKVRPMGLPTLSYIPSKGHSTLPYSDEHQNPNLIRVFIDVQHDYLHDRVYLVGALVVACENGKPKSRRHIVHLTDGPPDTSAKEEALFEIWIRDLLQAVVELSEPDSIGARRAPIHLVFWNDFGQRLLLDALARNFSSMVAAAPALYDFVTQIAAFDSPIASFLDAEIQEHKNYPMLCQSLQAVAAFLRFDWKEGTNFQSIFRERLFDGGGRIGEEAYARRSRHNSQIPLEFAYAVWDELNPPAPGKADAFAAYRSVTHDNLVAFQQRRLEAIEHVTQDFSGNRLSEKTPFDLPDLAQYSGRAHHLADALNEFVTIERHVELAAWKTGRQLPAERRVLLGETLLARYLEKDQEAGVAEKNRENEQRRHLKDQYYTQYRAANPDAKQVRLPKVQSDECRWSMMGDTFVLRLETSGADCDMDTMLALCDFEPGDWLLLYPRVAFDERLPVEQRVPNTPTPKQMLYGMRAELVSLDTQKDDSGIVVRALAKVKIAFGMSSNQPPGYLFNSIDRPLLEGVEYTLDPNPNNIYSFWTAKVAEGLVALEGTRAAGAQPASHTLYERVAGRSEGPASWTAAAAAGQALFMEGLLAFHAAGHLHEFELSKQHYIGAHGKDPILLVQGPPGTGKSYSTAFAVLARLQGAMKAGSGLRVFLSCKTHSATDVLLDAILQVQSLLADLRDKHPDLWKRFFDDRILSVPLLRLGSRKDWSEPVIALRKDHAPGETAWADEIMGHERCIIATTPGSIYSAIKGKWKGDLFGHYFCDLLILDEASQMSLPEAMMATLPLKPNGQLIVVGDPRQMPPIVKHDWETEPRRTFQEYKAYASLFEGLLALSPPMIKFEESFRLHAQMAEFLRREVYHQDGIRYHSKKHNILPAHLHMDPFVAAALSSEHPLVVIVHDEATSQTSNIFEQELLTPILRALADPATYGLKATEGIGVVVPHRAQRIALRRAFPDLCLVSEDTEEVVSEAIDTVERYQGEERDVIIVSATESDRYYLQVSGAFLLDPRRLTVALSRAKKKMILIASRSVFSYFSNDEQLFLHSLLWKNLLRRTTTEQLWGGERNGQKVIVWGTPTKLSNLHNKEC